LISVWDNRIVLCANKITSTAGGLETKTCFAALSGLLAWSVEYAHKTKLNYLAREPLSAICTPAEAQWAGETGIL
jgi:hypothetical protein